MNPLLLVDSYKIHHTKMYPDGMSKLYSNFTPRKSRIAGIDKVVVFGIQHFVLEYLIKQFNEEFFNPYKIIEIDTKEPNPFYGEKNEKPTIFKYERVKSSKEELINEYKKHCNVDTTHIEALWDLGYLPIEIKALDEGTLCPIGVPCMTITNTHPDFGWLVNYLETLISCMLWQPMTSATIAYEYKKLLNKYALETTGSTEGVQWQGHDFSMRGMSSVESAILSGMGHLTSFTGTDTIPAIYKLESSYNANGLIGASVPATEHSVMCMGTKESEIETFERLLYLYPTGILSIVSDTWDLWNVITNILPQLKEQILARDGKLVIRPDSGDPVKILTGYTIADFGDADKDSYRGIFQSYFPREEDTVENYIRPEVIKYQGKYYINPSDWTVSQSGEVKGKEISEAEAKGVIELLWDIFGGTINEQGYKVLDPHIGAIYGDSITLERANKICFRLSLKGFASTNVVLGIGSFTYQYNTRDTYGMAMKATYGEITSNKMDARGAIEPREIFKDPITDDGTKKSKRGLLTVREVNNEIKCADQVGWDAEKQGLLTTVFKDGKLIKETNLEEIRSKLKN